MAEAGTMDGRRIDRKPYTEFERRLWRVYQELTGAESPVGATEWAAEKFGRHRRTIQSWCYGDRDTVERPAEAPGYAFKVLEMLEERAGT